MYQRTVLIVEDDFLIRMVLADTLADEGYDVVEAANVLEAVAVLGQRKVDAVVTDVDMPGGLSGLDLAWMISSTHMDVPVIIASGVHRFTADELPNDAIFIPKPYRLDVIAAKVSELTARSEFRMTA
jgi:DNA-binding NtrC family response regulator